MEEIVNKKKPTAHIRNIHRFKSIIEDIQPTGLDKLLHKFFKTPLKKTFRVFMTVEVDSIKGLEVMEVYKSTPGVDLIVVNTNRHTNEVRLKSNEIPLDSYDLNILWSPCELFEV